MTSLILENADLNRLFPKCRPRLHPGPNPGSSNSSSSSSSRSSSSSSSAEEHAAVVVSATTTTTTTPHDHQQSRATVYREVLVAEEKSSCSNGRIISAANATDDMIDLERDTSDRCSSRKRTNGRKKSSSMSRRQASFPDSGNACADGAGSTSHVKQQQHSSSSSSSASGRSEDVPGHYGSDQQAQSQQDDSGTEESPVYILTSAKGDRSYKLRDSRIIEIAGGREVFSQSRGKVAARKPRFLAASNSLTNDDSQSDNKLSLKKNNKSPNRQSVWELRSRAGETRRQRLHREVTETVFSSEVHSVRRNTSKSILDYNSPKSNRSNRLINYDSILNSNNVEHNVAGPKSITDLEYGLPKNCIDSLGYQSSNHNATSGRNMALVSDGEVVVFDDIDDNWQNLRLDLGPSSNATTSQQQSHGASAIADDDLLLQSHHHQQQGRTPPEPLSSSICSSPSPTTTYHRNSSDFFKVITPASDCEADFPSAEMNHKGSSAARVIGELPIAQYSGSPRRYGVRENVRLPSLLSSPSSVYVAPRPGFPQRVLPTTPSQKEKDENCSEILVESNAVIESSVLAHLDDALANIGVTTTAATTTTASSPMSGNNSCYGVTSTTTPPTTITLNSSMAPISSVNLSSSPIRRLAEEDEDEDDEDEDDDDDEEQHRRTNAGVTDRAGAVSSADSPLKPFTLPGDNLSSLESLGGSTFDYLYEFSETRKVLEEFFKCPPPAEEKDPSETFPFQDLDYELRRQGGSAYVGQRLASVPQTTEEVVMVHESPKKHKSELLSSQTEHENNFLDLSVGTGSSEDLGETEVGLQVGHSRNFTLSPETTECDSNCGDLDSEMSLMMMDNELLPASGLLGSVGDLGNNSDSLRIYTSMPVLEDGLSSGHASDTDNNNPTVMLMKRQINEIEKEIIQRTRNDMLSTDTNDNAKDVSLRLQTASPELFITKKENSYDTTSELQLDGLDPLGTPPPPAPQSRQEQGGEVEAAIKDIRMALQRTKTLPVKSPSEEPPEPSVSPIWIPSLLDGRRRICTESNSEDSEVVRRKPDDADLEAEEAADEEEADTDLETDRLLGQQRTDDQGFYDDKGWRKPKTRTLLPSGTSSSATANNNNNNKTSVVSSVSVKPATPAKPPTSLSLVIEPLTAEPTQPVQQQQVSSNSPATGTALSEVTSPEQQQQQPGVGAGSPLDKAQATTSPIAKNSPSSPRSLKEPVSKDKEGKKKSRNKEALLDDPSVLIEGVLFRARYLGSTQLACEGQPTKSTRMCQAEEAVSRIKPQDGPSSPLDIQQSPQQVPQQVPAPPPPQQVPLPQTQDQSSSSSSRNNVTSAAYVAARCNSSLTSQDEEEECDSSEELMAGEAQVAVQPRPKPQQQQGLASADPTVFRLQFLGSVEVEEENGRKRRKRLKKHMVEEAVTKIKALAPDGESQPSTEVDLFISTEKIMVLNTDLKEIMMDHALRTISYIADIGDLVVLMARRRFVPHEMDEAPKNRTPKMICHVFESEEAQFIAQSIGQAFQVAYMEFLKANGIEDHSFVKEMDYQEVLNSQEIFGDELQMFAKKEMQKEVVVPKAKGEILGVVIVESGWGSMLPTVVIANLAPAGAAARCGQLNIGDQIIAINGVSLVGLPLSTCQTYIKNSKNQTVVKLTVVPCAPVVEVKIKRPDTKYQLGFSVQNGVICSLLRGGIAERGGVRVGHRIIEINNQSVVAVPHEKIVNLLATSVGEILMKTMPTSMFRLLTGQESPVYI
ncbi:serine-rich adhesin for platelets isoform X3 [Nasonia vitripennis]|uniref:Protein lin-10 n=1 Tax=Nasonia vitripennis TaxID=7425 RepID=A0A7M7Q0V4_NASVI|nr:serine-rich adhesin for platelets isoform X3 [Nasonia vitripennis]